MDLVIPVMNKNRSACIILKAGPPMADHKAEAAFIKEPLFGAELFKLIVISLPVISPSIQCPDSWKIYVMNAIGINDRITFRLIWLSFKSLLTLWLKDSFIIPISNWFPTSGVPVGHKQDGATNTICFRILFPEQQIISEMYYYRISLFGN